MPSPSATPKPKVPIARAPKSSSASWPHPSKALEAAVTICPPSFVGATAKYPPTYITEQVSPKHQFLPLAPLSTISELPKMELLEGIGPSQPAAIPPSQEPGGSSQDAPTKPVELDRSGTLDEGESKKDKVRSTSGLSSMLPSAPPAEAANIPLPQSPVTESPQQLDSDLRESQAEATGQNPEPATEEKDTWGARLASILPQTIVDQLPRQDTRTDNARATRSASVAPGAYPESDSMEDTPIPTSGPNLEGVQAEVGQADRDTPVPDSGSIRPRKSVSIALPEADQGHEDTAAKQTDTTKSNEDTSAKLPAPSPEEDADNKEAAKQSRDQDTMVENEQPGEISQDKRQNANAVAESEQSVEPDQGKSPKDHVQIQPQTYGD